MRKSSGGGGITAGIIGATGYAGAETARLLGAHPEVDGIILGSSSQEGRRIEEAYPSFLPGGGGSNGCTASRGLLGKARGALAGPLDVVAGADVVFAALPSGVGEDYAAACGERGVPFIDLSADFRFGADEATYTAWYGKPYGRPELRARSVYGLPELNRERLRELAAAGPVIVGNPGCYPTGASLAAWPALAKGLYERAGGGGDQKIVVDAASGVTGGGREPAPAFHFPECFDAVAPYKVGAHRHTPEISRNLSAMLTGTPTEGVPAEPVPLIFTPHLAPMNRGILSTVYIPLAAPWRAAAPDGPPRPPSKAIVEQAAAIRDLYRRFYRDEPFVRVLPEGVTASTGRVRQSNFCDLSVHLDQAGSTLIVVSAIDNMVKGAAGQAVQNMNVIFGFEETAGLAMTPASF